MQLPISLDIGKTRVFVVRDLQLGVVSGVEGLSVSQTEIRGF